MPTIELAGGNTMSAMASSHVARRACAIAGALVAAAALPLAAGSAKSLAVAPKLAARSAQQKSAQQKSAEQNQPQLALSVTSASPSSYATPNQTITLKGRLWNGGRSAIRGLSIGLTSSADRFTSETALEGFAAGTAPVGGTQVVAPQSIGTLRARQGASWTISLPVNALRLSCFGVYPLTVTAVDASGTLRASDPVPMPFWPSKPGGCATGLRPAPFPISWIWPLIDSPRQGPCPGLLDNSLAASVAPNGRLAYLLAVGAQYAASARLTWAIDPALLDNAQTMSQPYQVGGSANCDHSTQHGPDRDAQTWLANVARQTAGQPVFVTPYADVDMSWLAQYGTGNTTADLRRAFINGQRLAARLLRRDRTPAAIPAAANKLSAIAWPAGGVASQGVLANLGAMKIGTVILAMPQPQLYFTPGAVTSTLDGVGTRLKVLLGDYSLTNLLASSAVESRQSSAVFSVSQLFLAETAMIVAEAPSLRRPIVVTPPRRWDPPEPLAVDLLSDTVSAPWLRTQTAAQIAAQPPSSPAPPQTGSKLPTRLLRQLTSLDNNVSLLQSITVGADSRLNHAVFGIESSRWADTGVAGAQARLTSASEFVMKQFGLLSVGGQKVIDVTLGGRVGSLSVSIKNSAGYPVRVGLEVTSSNSTVTARQRSPHAVYEVAPHSSTGLKLSVSATQTGKATVRLRLTSPAGTLLPNPPDKPLVMKISATNLGTVALVIFAAALAVFVVVSAAQAIRRGRPGASQAEDDTPDDGGDAAGALGPAPDEGEQGSPARAGRAHNVAGR